MLNWGLDFFDGMKNTKDFEEAHSAFPPSQEEDIGAIDSPLKLEYSRILSGLANLGNTCYMNSTLQCIVHCPTFVSLILDSDDTKDFTASLKSLTQSMSLENTKSHMSRRYGGERSGVYSHLQSVKYQLGKANSLFSDFRQHDAMTLLRTLLQLLQKEMDQVPQPKPYPQSMVCNSLGAMNFVEASDVAWQSFLSRENSPLVQKIFVQRKTTKRCRSCLYQENYFDTANFLMLPVPSESDMDFILNEEGKLDLKWTENKDSDSKDDEIPLREDRKEEEEEALEEPPPVTTINEIKVIVQSFRGKDSKIELINVSLPTPSSTLGTLIEQIVLNCNEMDSEAMLGNSKRSNEETLANNEEILDDVYSYSLSSKERYIISVAKQTEENIITVAQSIFFTPDYAHTNLKDVLSDSQDAQLFLIITKINEVINQGSQPFHLPLYCFGQHEEAENVYGPLTGALPIIIPISHSSSQESIIGDIFIYLSRTFSLDEQYLKKSCSIRFADASSICESVLSATRIVVFVSKDDVVVFKSALDSILGNGTITVSSFLSSLKVSRDEAVVSSPKEKTTRIDASIEESPQEVKLLKQVQSKKKDKKKSKTATKSDAKTSYCGNFTLRNSFTSYSQFSKLNGEKCCPNCQTIGNFEINYELWKPPKLLIINLLRIEFDRYGEPSRKLSGSCDFPLENLDLAAYVGKKPGSFGMYDLHGVVEHLGGCQGGHYIAHCRVGELKNSEWYYFSDSHVAKASAEDISRQNSYIYFYERRD